MTIQEILEAHKHYRTYVADDYSVGVTCTCGEEILRRGMLSDASHRAHVAEVLDKHMREREYWAWESGYEEGAVHAVGIRAHIDGLIKRDPKRPSNPYRKDTTNGR